MRSPWRAAWGVVTVVLELGSIGGCGPRVNRDETESMLVEPDQPAESTSTGELGRTATSIEPGAQSSGDDEPVVCPEGEVACANECANLRWSEQHCGSCGHACTVVGATGECWEGVCPPRRYCALAEQGHQTCASVCASYGETCVDTEPEVPGACGDHWYDLIYDLTSDFDCEVGSLSSMLLMRGCNEPIEWDLLGGINGNTLPGAVSCCCTQP